MMGEKTMAGFTLADVLAWEAGARKDAVLAGLWGDDLKARDDKEIAQAVSKVGHYQRYNSYRRSLWKAPGEGAGEFAVDVKDDVIWEICEKFDIPLHGPLEFPFYIWQTREGKPYQADLEAAVSAWRRAAPAYSQDTPEGWWAMRGLLTELLGRGFYIEINLHGEKEVAVKWCAFPFYARLHAEGRYKERFGADTLPHAVTNAAIAALWNEETKGVMKSERFSVDGQ